MTRSGFRRLWLITTSIMLGAAMYAHGEYETLVGKVGLNQKAVDRLIAERRSGSQITASLSDLDSRTIDENYATKLDLLRYLGLEESRINITFNRPATRRVGGVELTSRSVTVSGAMPYEEALNQLDYFYNTKKMAIKSLTLTHPGKQVYGDIINFNMIGEIYGLPK